MFEVILLFLTYVIISSVMLSYSVLGFYDCYKIKSEDVIKNIIIATFLFLIGFLYGYYAIGAMHVILGALL